MKIKAVIFDLDGTLANTLPLCIQAFRESVQPLIQRTLSDEEIVATFGPSEEGTIMALAPDHYKEGVAAYLHLYAELHNMCPAPFEGMPEILQKLKQKNVPVAMVTGKGKHSTAISLQYFSLTGYFSVIETGAPLGPRKVQGIQAVLETWPEIDKREVIYVGDAPSDITASRAAGISVVAAAWASTANAEILKSMNPDQLFLSIQAFSDWLIENIE
jgi:phosphoglycolate phosphatase-like HAD superfamily hydrolase